MTVNVLLAGRPRLDGYGQGHPQAGDGSFGLSRAGKGGTVRDVLCCMGLPPERVTTTMWNGRKCHQGLPLKSGDRVILIPREVAALWRFLGHRSLGIEGVLDL